MMALLDWLRETFHLGPDHASREQTQAAVDALCEQVGDVRRSRKAMQRERRAVRRQRAALPSVGEIIGGRAPGTERSR